MDGIFYCSFNVISKPYLFSFFSRGYSRNEIQFRRIFTIRMHFETHFSYCETKIFPFLSSSVIDYQ